MSTEQGHFANDIAQLEAAAAGMRAVLADPSFDAPSPYGNTRAEVEQLLGVTEMFLASVLSNAIGQIKKRAS